MSTQQPTTPSGRFAGTVPRLLWIDGLGGLAVGLLVLLLHGWLAGVQGLPEETLIFMGVTNLAYGTYSTSLARRTARPMGMIVALSAANVFWLPCCLAIAFVYRESLTAFGALHVIGEGLYVGALGAVEWTIRRQLVGRSAPE